MATGGTDKEVKGLGEGTMQWIPPFQLKNESGSEMFGVDVDGNVTYAGTSTITSASDITITNATPTINLADSTGSAKDLTITVNADKAQLRETAGAAGTLLVLDLANNRVGVATASPTVALDVTGAVTASTAVTGGSFVTAGDITVNTDKFTVAGASGNTLVAGTLAVTGVLTPGGVARTAQKRLFTSVAKVGATSGWVVSAADNKNSLGRLPASQTSSTLVIPISGLKVGDTVTAFHLLGQVESAGGAVTLDADLRKQSAAAADNTDASVGAMTQASLSADTALSVSNTAKTGLSDVVGADESFYLLITGTTEAATDIDLLGVAVTVTEA